MWIPAAAALITQLLGRGEISIAEIPFQSLMRAYSFGEMRPRGESSFVFYCAKVGHGVSQFS